ncbi:hypothetical protein, conserved [Leishmania donovani]|uniref:Uncharacterized protein n=1 Tax=Leishmania donovani TaxID=5661 RepID=A0A3S7XAG8_LEIDO|nr:hypothetical protein, conserved [Leishmania donovani]AYU83374.1 hypothetical protein LdCL_360008100 [Leishmania donovani]TPP48148.1 hypothetical protein CGC21_12490 [Leishmania donovani]CBZ38469.1 hypothetical protein, conserved [Leishmania donovani]
MRRREAESAARFYMAGMLVGLLGLLLSCGYSFGLFHSPDEVEQLNAAIRTVEGRQVALLLDSVFSNGTRFDGKGHIHPLYALACVQEEETEEARRMIRNVARRFRTEPIDIGYAHHPLTAAYRHHRYAVAQALIEEWRRPAPNVSDEEAVMDEVYASSLTVSELQRVDPSVHVYCRDADAVRCRALDPERIRDASNSRLEAAYRRRFGQTQELPTVTPYRDTDMPSKIVAPASTVRAAFWDDPFRPLVPDLLPPRTAMVMNPGYFDNVLDQLSYTLLGHMEGSSTVVAFGLFAMCTMCLFLGTWCAGVSYWLLHYT